MLLPEAGKCPQCPEKLLSTWSPVPIQVFYSVSKCVNQASEREYMRFPIGPVSLQIDK